MSNKPSDQWLEDALSPEEDERPTLARPYTAGGAHLGSDGFRLHAVESGFVGEDEDTPGFEATLREIARRETVATFVINGRLLREALPEDGTTVTIRLVEDVLELFWWDGESPRRYACIATMYRQHGPRIPWRPFGIDEEE